MAPRPLRAESFRSREQRATLALLRTAEAIERHFGQAIERPRR